MGKSHLLIVTRETALDQAYGLGKSIAPLKSSLESLAWEVTYFCQTSLSEEDLKKKDQFVFKVQSVLWAHRLKQDAWVGALAERWFMGERAALLAKQKGVSHVHLHDPWLALGYLVQSAWLNFKAKFKTRAHEKDQEEKVTHKKLTHKVRVGLTEHGFGAYYQAVRLDGVQMGPWVLFALKVLERYICARMDWVIAPTQRALDQLEVDLGINLDRENHAPSLAPAKGQACNLGTPDRTSRPVPKHWFKVLHPLPLVTTYSKNEARRQIGLPLDARVILSVGRLAPLKQFGVVVDVFAQLSKSFDPLHLVILGGGDQTSLRQQALDSGVGDRVHFAFSRAVDLYYSAADVYVSASLTESFGLANLEALAHGLPSVCTHVGGVPEVVEDAAYLVDPTKEDLLRGLQAVLSDPTLASSLSERAKSRAQHWPNATEITQRYVQIYQ